MNYLKIGLDRFAKFDLSISRIRQRNYKHQPSWPGVYIYLLKCGDTKAAEMVRQRNETKCPCLDGRESQ